MKERVLMPSPISTVKALMSMGYDFNSAIADIIDNSIDANATEVDLYPVWNEGNPYILLADNGKGMNKKELEIAMSLGANAELCQRSDTALGKFGYGLKSASFSQCRRLTVFSKKNNEECMLSWDINEVEKRNEWVVFENLSSVAIEEGKKKIKNIGTVIIWEDMYRLLDNLDNLQEQQNYFYSKINLLKQHLSLTFHKFLETKKINIKIFETEVDPWNPLKYAVKKYPTEVVQYKDSGKVEIKSFLLQHQNKLDTNQYEELQGSDWIKNQGVYVYRNNRLISQLQWLGYQEPRRIYNYIRIEVVIDSSLDEQVNLDVKKMHVILPDKVQKQLKVIIDNSLNDMKKLYFSKIREVSSEIKEIQHVWGSKQLKNGVSSFHINDKHPIISSFIKKYKIKKNEINGIFSLIEKTFPYEEIKTSTVSKKVVSEHYLREQLYAFYETYKNMGWTVEQIFEQIKYIEPFNNYLEIVLTLLGEFEEEYRGELYER